MRFNWTADDLKLVETTYAGLHDELANSNYTAHEKSLLCDTHLYYGNYLSPRSVNYFVNMVLPPIASAIGYFGLQTNSAQKIADIGCGGGMQSLIFAALGARVVGFDLREDSLALCRKRQAYFEARLGKKLDMEYVQCDFGKADTLGLEHRFDGAFSMSAFSYVQPMENAVRVLDTMLKPAARVFLFERNALHLADGFKYSKSVAPPSAVSAEFKRRGFAADIVSGTCALPKELWRNSNLNWALKPANAMLSRSLRFSTNYVLGLSRTESGVTTEHSPAARPMAAKVT
jgi:SAM-dependent methyltransferase